MGEQFTSIKDIKPGQKNINIMFIVLDIGIFNSFYLINSAVNFKLLICLNKHYFMKWKISKIKL